MPDKPTIAVYGIYKDEEKSMARFLNSVQPADEIILCDIGSDDHTNQIINQFKASHPQINIQVYSICVSPWRFDDARNTALSLINPGIDICISLNIDEYFMDGWKEQLMEQWEIGYTRYAHMLKIISPEGNSSECWRERIHSRSGYTWKLPVHEILAYKDEEKIKNLPDLYLYKKPDHDQPRFNYLPLLEQSVKEKPDYWPSWSFLADEYLLAGRPDDALQAIDQALNLDNNDKAYLYKKKFLVYQAQNQVDSALLNLNNAIYHLPCRRELYFDKAVYLHQLGRHMEAYFTLKESEKFTEKIFDRHYSPNAWNTEFSRWKSQFLEHVKKEGINFE